MKKLFILTVVVLFFLTACLFFHKNKKKYNNNSNEILNIEGSGKIDKGFIKIANEINLRNNKINTILIKSMPIKLKNGSMTFRLNGNLAFQKEKLFRLIISHKITGREMDLGSNDSVFWFYSKRTSPAALYYSTHENLNKTNLKTPLNPFWMIESLNLNEINFQNITSIKENESSYQTFEKRKSVNEEIVYLTTVVDKLEKKIISRNIFRENKSMLTSTKYIGNIMIISWPEEDIIMEWDISDKQTNVKLESNLWNLPDYKKKINIGK